MLNYLRKKKRYIKTNIDSYLRKIRITRQIDKTKIAHLQKTVNCKYQWYGNSYGGFYILPALVNNNSIIYSIGIGTDLSFDLKCIKKHKCTIHGFDPTPISIHWVKEQKLPSSFIFHEYGICATQSGRAIFYLPANEDGVSGSIIVQNDVNEKRFVEVELKNFNDITSELGHTHIDVLKIDIEGAEYEVLENILELGVTIDQILIEFHDRLFNQDVFRSKSIVEKMNNKGYCIFACSLSYEEVSFVHRRKLAELNILC